MIGALMRAIEEKGWNTPMPIQERAIKLILRGHNVT